MFKNKTKEKQKGLPPSRYVMIGTAFAVGAFIVLAFLLRGPFIERLTVTPTIVSRLVSPGPTVTTTMMDGVTTAPQFTATPLPVVAEATGTPTPFGIPITLTANADLKAGPGEATEVVERVNAGDTLLLIGANNTYTWFLVGYRSRVSWVNIVAIGVAIDSLRQLPVVVQEDIGMAGPTLTPSSPINPPTTMTLFAAITGTPVLAQLVGDRRIRAVPDDTYPIIAQAELGSLYRIHAVSDDGNWFLARFFSSQDEYGNPIQGWVMKGPGQDLISGSLSSVPVVNRTQAALQATTFLTNMPSSRVSYTPTRSQTTLPFPTFTRTMTPSPTPT